MKVEGLKDRLMFHDLKIGATFLSDRNRLHEKIAEISVDDGKANSILFDSSGSILCFLESHQSVLPIKVKMVIYH